MLVHKRAGRGLGSLSVLFALFSFTVSESRAEEIRVGLAHQSEVEIRCDGDFRALVRSGSGGPVDLDPGIYTIRVVEAADFFRAAPWVAGIISAPNPSLVAVNAYAGTPTGWRVELLRTRSKRTADRAEKDARNRLGGRISRTERDGWIVLEMGSFPNEYLAKQAHMKARRLGLPARLERVGAENLWDTVGAAGPTRKVIRLRPEGQAPVSNREEYLSEEDLGELTPLLPISEGLGEEAMSDLPPLSEEELSLDPLPPLDPDELLVEPLPEPKAADLGPELGFDPAPPSTLAPAPKPKKIRLPRPIRNAWRTARAKVGGPKKAPTRIRNAPPSQPPRPRKKSAPGTVRVPAPAPPPASKGAPSKAKPPLPRAPQQIAPVPETAPEMFPEPVIPGKPPKKNSYVFRPQQREPRGFGRLRSLPIIRRFWWEKPLVERVSEEEIKARMDEALSLPSDEPPLAVVEDVPPAAIADTGPAPTPRPFDPGEARQRDAQVDSTEPASEPRPFGEPDPVQLPTESDRAPVVVESSEDDLLPPVPGFDDIGEDPLLIQPDDSRVVDAPEPRAPTTPSLPSLPKKSVAARTADPDRIARSYVQLFDEEGKPVTDPSTSITLGPLTGSRLEFDGASYHGSFQAYAPSEEWLVLVNTVDLEDYLAGIVPGEIPPGAPAEVVKAQTVLSRCYAMLLASRGDYADYGYDIPGSKDSEWPYMGRRYETPATVQAARDTAGEVLIEEGGSLSTPVYCFSSGGYVADALSIWGDGDRDAPSYLVARPDFASGAVDFEIPPEGFAKDEKRLEAWLKSSPETYDKQAAGEHFRWEKRLSTGEMEELVNRYWNNQVGEVREIRITQRAVSGHATRMEIIGSSQKVTARDSYTIREALGLDSSLIVVDKRFGVGWTIHGGGYGHGVGMSQCGAIGLVKKENANYRQVLNFYFKKLLLGKRELVRVSGGA